MGNARVTNPGPAPNPAGCSTCGSGVPPTPSGPTTSAQRRAWAMSQVGRPIANPGCVGSWPGRSGWGAGNYNAAMASPDAVVNGSMLPNMAPQPPRPQPNPGGLGPLMLALRAEGYVPGQGYVENPRGWGPRRRRRRMRRRFHHRAAFQPFGYADGYAPGSAYVPAAYPGWAPGFYTGPRGCLTNYDCARSEYCHGGICMTDPWRRNVGVQQVASVGGQPVDRVESIGGRYVRYNPTPAVPTPSEIAACDSMNESVECEYLGGKKVCACVEKKPSSQAVPGRVRFAAAPAFTTRRRRARVARRQLAANPGLGHAGGWRPELAAPQYVPMGLNGWSLPHQAFTGSMLGPLRTPIPATNDTVMPNPAPATRRRRARLARRQAARGVPSTLRCGPGQEVCGTSLPGDPPICCPKPPTGLGLGDRDLWLPQGYPWDTHVGNPVGDLAYGMPPGYMSHKNAHEIGSYGHWLANQLGPQSNLPGWAEHKLSQARVHVGDVKHYVEHEGQHQHRAPNPGTPVVTQQKVRLAPPGHRVR